MDFLILQDFRPQNYNLLSYLLTDQGITVIDYLITFAVQKNTNGQFYH